MRLKTNVILTLSFLTFWVYDIAPNPIEAKGIYPSSDCKIRMESEFVEVNLFKNRSTVECTFELLNYGTETNLEIGFPVMNFHHYDVNEYSFSDKDKFEITVDGLLLTREDIKVPKELDSLYKSYLNVEFSSNEYYRKRDSVYQVYGVEEIKDGYKYPKGANPKTVNKILDSLWHKYNEAFELSSELYDEFYSKVESGKYPWYVWKAKFAKNQNKVINVKYELPAGLGYLSRYRYFKYILHSGAGWYKTIGKADIVVKLNDVELNSIEEISPKPHKLNEKEKIINWLFNDLEPTKANDIYIKYYDKKERRKSHRILNKKGKLIRRNQRANLIYDKN